jgi:hypothetical protein
VIASTADAKKLVLLVVFWSFSLGEAAIRKIKSAQPRSRRARELHIPREERSGVVLPSALSRVWRGSCLYVEHNTTTIAVYSGND